MTNKLIRTYDADQVASALEQEGTFLVDVLTPEHYASRHIPGSAQACVYEVDFVDQVKALGASPDSLIIFYGAGEHSQDSTVAAEKLAREGYVNIGVFPAGLSQWRSSGRELAGEAAGEIEPPHPVLQFDKDSYALVADESVLRWTGRNNTGAHFGLLPIVDGRLERAGEGLAGTFTLDMAGLVNVDLEGDELKPVLENHLKSDDFFFVSKFPKATFEVKTMTPISGAAATSANFTVHGVLDLRGIRKLVTFEAHLRPLGDGRLVLMANLDLDRTKWGVIYGSARFFAHLGYHVVHDNISVDFRLVLG